ncbi:hypothetical protein BN440_2722 [Erwinia amylovora MR1]|nr:hypothetical protein BN440_2722 [Erwinia amylovora MR1]
MFKTGLLKRGFTLSPHGSQRFPVHSRFPLIDFPRVVVHFVIFGKIDVVMIAYWHSNTFIFSELTKLTANDLQIRIILSHKKFISILPGKR